MSKTKIKLLRGRFYSIYTTGSSHPSLIFKKNKRKNRYFAVVFDSSNGRHRTKLKHPTSPNVSESYAQNRPILGVKQDFGNHELLNIKVHKDDKPIIIMIERRPPRMTKKYKKIRRAF